MRFGKRVPVTVVFCIVSLLPLNGIHAHTLPGLVTGIPNISRSVPQIETIADRIAAITNYASAHEVPATITALFNPETVRRIACMG
ncbi:MAG: hypothetical protein A2293_03780 [Elusimicrobia bacterium RIFOXYB2_FULL_49_7]|nr:MAG: hypothetical protein A2293_03780 [Elusimicrobia bacterium RIFOXYB2_FULL_49_7]